MGHWIGKLFSDASGSGLNSAHHAHAALASSTHTHEQSSLSARPPALAPGRYHTSVACCIAVGSRAYLLALVLFRVEVLQRRARAWSRHSRCPCQRARNDCCREPQLTPLRQYRTLLSGCVRMRQKCPHPRIRASAPFLPASNIVKTAFSLEMAMLVGKIDADLQACQAALRWRRRDTFFLLLLRVLLLSYRHDPCQTQGSLPCPWRPLPPSCASSVPDTA
eukprot:660788-Rhodomonas_salina.3